MEEDVVKKPSTHEVGEPLDALSVAELENRIALLEGEIGRLRQAIAAKSKSRADAEAAFRF